MWTRVKYCFLVLVQQIIVVSAWSTWNEWSACSVSCGGGLASQTRRCYGDSSCYGIGKKYRHCNTWECKGDYTNENERICHLHNTMGGNGQQSLWIPVSQQTYQCFVICRDATGNVPNEIQANKEDGTKCGSQPNFYCVDGKCQRLGCDGVLWSNKDLDVCGVCGGDGSSCSQNSKNDYQWRINWSRCSVSCGTGYQTSVAVCYSKKSNSTTHDYYCKYTYQPDTGVRECSRPLCGPRWELSKYGPCSAQCEGGVQRRNVRCVMDSDRSNLIVVGSYRCPDPIPISEKSCNLHFCPARWRTGKWSPCSVTCGIGSQQRSLSCIKSPVYGIEVNVSHSECFGPRPMWSRTCSSEACFKFLPKPPSIQAENSTFIQTKRMKRVYLSVGGRAILLPRQPVKIKCDIKNMDSGLILWTKDNRLISVSPYQRVHVTRKGVLTIKRTDPSLDAGKFTCMAGLKMASIELSFQNKKKASKTAKKLLKHMKKDQLMSINTPQSDTAVGPTGPLNFQIVGNTNYSILAEYMTGDWSACSRTCGVGIQTRKVSCNLVSDKFIKIVPNEQCQQMYKPENFRKCVLLKNCPTWKVGKWGECSISRCKTKGKAVQVRSVKCGDGPNGALLPRSKCKNRLQPKDWQECDNHECVVEWKASKWTKCKPTCARRGKKFRIFSCVWKGSNKIAYTQCRELSRPKAWKRCKPRCKHKCKDHSRYCSLVGRLKMCRFQTFKTKCCQTCKS